MKTAFRFLGGSTAKPNLSPASSKPNLSTDNINNNDEVVVHVPMDFRGSCGRIVSPEDITDERDRKVRRERSRRNHSCSGKEWREDFLQPWFHGDLSREDAGNALLKYGQLDGSFLVRFCGRLEGVFVLSYLNSNRVYHTKILTYNEYDIELYSLDNGKTKFFDLIQIVEFYRVNQGELMTKLSHYLEKESLHPLHQLPHMDAIELLEHVDADRLDGVDGLEDLDDLEELHPDHSYVDRIYADPDAQPELRCTGQRDDHPPSDAALHSRPEGSVERHKKDKEACGVEQAEDAGPDYS